MSNAGFKQYTVNGTTHPNVLIRWEDERKSMLTASISKGGGTLPHIHDGIETITVENGTGLMTIGGQERRVSVGDVITIPPNTVHSLVSEYGDLLVQAVFDPPFSEQETIITEPSSA